MEIQRARSRDAKAQRTEDLLQAAEDIAKELGGVRHVTLAPVTERAGLHRTAVRRYFANKEDLLLELAERGWGQWRAAMASELEGKRGLGPKQIAEVIVKTLADLPVFLDALTLATLQLEKDVPLERARKYKTRSFEEHRKIISALVESTVLTKAQAEALVTASASLAATYWQVAHPSPTLAELYEQESAWGHVAYSFQPKLLLLVESTAIGLMHTLTEA